MNPVGPYGEWAKKYREWGWLGTIPLPPGEKHPPPKGYTGSGRPHPTDAEVTDWVKQQPDGNLGLRLSDVPKKYLPKEGLPVVYAGNNVDGWELLGIDVDNYKDKHGYDEMRELCKELGELPETATCTARWGTGSGTAVYLVPKGYRFMGKAASAIDVIQKRHRFTIGYPSTNPDANNAKYQWMYGAPKNLKIPKLYQGFEDVIPSVAEDVAVLPESWFTHLSRGGMIETDDPISGLSDDELYEWLTTLRFDDDMCKRMQDVLARCINDLGASASSHDKLTKAHWELIRLAAEGHSGVGNALNEYHPSWWKHCVENRGGDPETAHAEIVRSINGALDKTQPNWINPDGKPFGRPDDSCNVDKSKIDVDAWEKSNDEDIARKAAERIAEADFGGLGPVIGRMPLGDAKDAGEYGRHDDGNAQHYVDLYGENVKYIGARKSWILWDGARWYDDNEDRLVRSAYRRVRIRQEAYASELRTTAAADPTDKGAKTKARLWSDWAKRSGDLAPIKAALESARACFVGDEPVVLKADKLDATKSLLGCANGVIDLQDDDIDVRPARKEDYVTYNTNVDYIPWRALVNGETDYFEAFDIWQEYLNWFLPDPVLQRFVRKALGHMLVGENPEKLIIFLFGPPNSGKSTLIGAIKGAVGDYAGTVDMSLFKPRDLNPGLVRAVPHRITSMSEMEDTTKTGVIDASVVKRLTGNDEISAELKHSNEIFTGKPQFTTVIACNNPPNIRNADAALYERLLVLPLDRPIDKKLRRYDRQTDIQAKCGVAVLSWLIEGWKDYQREKLDPDDWPLVVKRANQIFAADLNTVARYMNQYLERAKDTDRGRRVLETAKRKSVEHNNRKLVSCLPLLWTPEAARVYNHYRTATQKVGDEPVDMQQFTKDLGVGRTDSRKINGKGTSVYVGVRFKDEPDDRAERFTQKY